MLETLPHITTLVLVRQYVGGLRTYVTYVGLVPGCCRREDKETPYVLRISSANGLHTH